MAPPSKARNRKQQSSRARMVSTMALLLRRQGYAATGLKQLMVEAEAPMGSMYFHFPQGKEQLAAEAVAQSGGELGRMLAALLATSASADAVRAIAEAMSADLERSRWHNGCPIATTALEMAADCERIRSATQAVFDQWELLFVQRLAADGLDGQRAHAAAKTVIAALEGALILARTCRSGAPLRDVAEVVASWLATETGAAQAVDRP